MINCAGLQGVEATVFGMLMSLHISSFMLGKFGSALTAAFGVTSGNFTNLANLVMVCAARPIFPLLFSLRAVNI
jgi:hypothetical protein